ncbi:MAG: DMT family transporter [Rhodospirillales bacterium]
MSRRAGLAALAAAATGVQVGAATVASRFVLAEIDPASLAMLRYAIGFLCLVPALVAAERARFERRDLPAIAALGIAQFGVLIWLLNFGLRYIPAGRAALIFALFPLLTMLIAAALGHERLTAPKTLGVLATILGVGLALGEKAAGSGADGWIGEIAVLASALCGAACAVLYRPYLRKYPTLPVSALAMLASVAFLAVPAWGEGFFAQAPGLSARGWAAVAFIGLSSGVFYFLWLWALNNATPTRVTVFLALSPVTAMLLGAAFLGEAVTAPSLAGLGCVALGLWLAHRPQSSSASRTG